MKEAPSSTSFIFLVLRLRFVAVGRVFFAVLACLLLYIFVIMSWMVVLVLYRLVSVFPCPILAPCHAVCSIWKKWVKKCKYA
jgi:hypothetical protein